MLSQTLDILNFAQLEQFIRSLCYLALDQNKTLRISNLDIFACVEQIFFSLLSDFLSLRQTFPQYFQRFYNFSSQISPLSTPPGTIAATVPARMSKVSQTEFFGFF